MTAKTILATATLSALLLSPDLARAQTAAAAAPAPAPASALDEFFKPIKQPAPWLKLGGDFRVRNEYYNNIVTLDERAALHEQDVIRYRGRLFGTATASPDVAVNARLSFEARGWQRPAFVGAFRNKTGAEWRYALFDNLNVKWSKAFDLPLTITLGRQDILIGDFYDWWLFADGTPGDGSWAFFLDAARFTWEAKDIQTKFDLIAIAHDSRPDAWLPTLGRSTSYPLTDQDEKGLAFYVTNKSVKDTTIDGYFIYKNDRRRTYTVAGAKRTPGDAADIGTLGGKVTGTPASNWQYSVEAALQFGSKNDRISGVTTRRDLRAYGGKGKLTYLFQDGMKNQLSLGTEILSGDDPKTAGKDEMFDMLWGRWPRWSELYIYSYINETSGKIAQLNNLARFEFTWTCVPARGANFSLSYQPMLALEKTPSRTVAPTLFSNTGGFRGHYVQAILKYQFNKYLTGHLWSETVKQGNFYTRRDTLSFFRAELMFTF
jgi:hypothetical protein